MSQQSPGQHGLWLADKAVAAFFFLSVVMAGLHAD